MPEITPIYFNGQNKIDYFTFSHTHTQSHTYREKIQTKIQMKYGEIDLYKMCTKLCENRIMSAVGIA